MSLNNTTYRYQYGIAISETGLNKVSKALRITKPGLFSNSTQIPIKAATPTDPAHILTLYTLVDQNSLIFDLYPLNPPNTGVPDSFNVTTHVDFSLTDNILGLVTKIGVTIGADGLVTRNTSTNLQISLLDFNLLSIVGEAPDFTSKLIKGVIDTGNQIKHSYHLDQSPDQQLADSFVAIVTYLINLFLKDGLSKAIVNFPIPDLKNIIKFGNITFSNAELWGPFIRNNTFYVMLGQDLGTPASFPVELLPPADVRVGISKSGLDRIAAGLLPYNFPTININNPYNTLYFHIDKLRLVKSTFSITPGNSAIGVQIFFDGTFQMDIQFNVPLINKHVDIPVPIPLDPLSNYTGSVQLNLQVDPYAAGSTNAAVHLDLVAATKFFDGWYLFVLTDYRDKLVQIATNWINQFENNFIVSFLTHIPIIGWIISQTLNLVKWAIAYVTGLILDVAVSLVLNFLINTLGRLAVDLFLNNNFDIFNLPQKDFINLTGMPVASGQVLTVDDGRNGELELRLAFDSTYPPTTVTTNPPQANIPAPTPAAPPPVPGIQQNPVYTAADFKPALQLPAPRFLATSERFSITSTVNGTVTTGNLTVTFVNNNGAWTLQRSYAITGGGSDTASVLYSADFRPQHLQHASVDPSGVSFLIGFDNDLTQNIVHVSTLLNGNISDKADITLLPGVTTETSEFWLYRLAYTPLQAGSSGNFAMVSVSGSLGYSNWARIVPVKITSVADQTITINNPAPGAPTTLAGTKILAQDEDGSYEIITLKSGGLYSTTFNGNGVSIIIKSI